MRNHSRNIHAVNQHFAKQGRVERDPQGPLVRATDEEELSIAVALLQDRLDRGKGFTALPAELSGVFTLNTSPVVESLQIYDVETEEFVVTDVRYMLRAGEPFNVPLDTGSGLNQRFYAHGVRVNVLQRANGDLIPVTQPRMVYGYPQSPAENSGVNAAPWTPKVSVYNADQAPLGEYTYNPNGPVPFLQFFWNLQFGSDRTLYSDGWLPAELLNQMPDITVPSWGVPIPRGGSMHHFSVPRLVPPDTAVVLQMLPVTSMAQLAANAAESVVINVELQGQVLVKA